jgi:hypothetical protein
MKKNSLRFTLPILGEVTPLYSWKAYKNLKKTVQIPGSAKLFGIFLFVSQDVFMTY